MDTMPSHVQLTFSYSVKFIHDDIYPRQIYALLTDFNFFIVLFVSQAVSKPTKKKLCSVSSACSVLV